MKIWVLHVKVAEGNQPSRVGQKLSDLTTSRVVLLVLAMLFVLPVFNIGSGIYGTAPPLGSAGVKVWSDMAWPALQAARFAVVLHILPIMAGRCEQPKTVLLNSMSRCYTSCGSVRATPRLRSWQRHQSPFRPQP